MRRQYYISKDLDDLKTIEHELTENGLVTPQFHVLSENDAEVEKRHLHAIESVLKKDVVRSTTRGAIVGVIASLLVLALAYFTGWYTSPAGWIPFGFLAVVLLGFCTWEGGLIGIQVPNYQFKRFQKLLEDGNHVFFVDINDEQLEVLQQVVKSHASLRHAGTGDATPEWVVKSQEKFNKFMKTMP